MDDAIPFTFLPLCLIKCEIFVLNSFPRIPSSVERSSKLLAQQFIVNCQGFDRYMHAPNPRAILGGARPITV